MIAHKNTVQVIRRFSFDEWGGTETVVWNTIRQMAAIGGHHELVATAALDHLGQTTVDNIRINRFPYIYPRLNLSAENKYLLDKKGGNPYSLQMYRYLVQVPNLDLIHCHTMQRIATMVRLAAAKRRIPYVVSLHGGCFSVPQSEIDEMSKPYKGTLNYGKLLDIILHNNRFLDDADGIICVGYNEYLETRERYPDKLVEYIPNGVNPDKFACETDCGMFRKKYHIPKESKLILCVSRIDYQKNQLLLIDLLQRLKEGQPGWHLLLIGPVTSPPYYNNLRERISAYQLEQNVTVIEGMNADDPELVAAYKAADCFILPSRHEPFGIVVLEAWAASLPVIAAGVGGLKKLIRHKKNGLLFEDNSLDDLVANVEMLGDAPQLQTELVMNALKEVDESYSWQRVVETLLSFYDSVLSKFRK